MDTKIDKLILSLCPNGVEFKRLDEIFNTKNGYTPSKSNSSYWNGNTCIPWFRMEDIREHGNILMDSIQHITPNAVKGKLFPKDSIIVATSATIGKHALIRIESLANQRFTYLVLKEEYNYYYNIKFLYYYCYKLDEWCLTHLNQSNFASVDMGKFHAFTFPVPPLEVQNEIVRILDNFTGLIKELTKELTARKKQYEYYRNLLFTFTHGEIESIHNTFNWIEVELKDVIDSLTTGLNPRQFFKLNTDDAKNYYVTIRELHNNTIIFSDRTDKINDEALILCNNRSNLEIGDVLFSGTGTIGETAVILEKPINWNIKEGIYAIKPKKNMLNSKFLMYLLRTPKIYSNIMNKVIGGTVKSIPMKEMKMLKISIPSIQEQEKIVTILDHFDTLCNDLTTGLPAEIEARKKQYEYYRDKLLSFQEQN